MKRLLIAALLAACTVTLTWFLFLVVLGMQITFPSDANVAETFARWLVLFLVGILIFGLPTHWLLTRLKLRQWWCYVFASCVTVGGGMWALSGFPSPVSEWMFFVGFWLPCVACAALGALAFWIVGVRGAPSQIAGMQPGVL